MTRKPYRYECDNDLHHQADQTTTVRQVDEQTAELLDLLALPHRDGRARLSRVEWQRVESLKAWAGR